ncbi:MAG: orotidine-5'-phosphate decarboxylase [Bacteroidetes bacterium]|uniref:Orotidine 5'-phosphate decarboxylase n=1 Tax=Candidatus Cryptobacteroides merdigallinarum TaxID=2840770 RepID=A0A9D9HE57_9BACT|nr:orotidine-5'-phosphate decarboxylase [Candidatus Cryptobacteroides merdigallinarum]
MDREDLYRQIQAKKTMLCVGLDVDYAKMPEHIKGLASSEIAIKGQLFGGKARSIIEFNKAIIDATAPYCVAYKPNLAFYECYGSEGMRALEATVDYIRTTYPGIFLIADAKRGDIGNTAKMYARAFFELMDFDAVTLSPYMGQDSILPFLEYKGRWAIVLALTSNASAEQFQMAEKEGKPLYRAVMEEMMSISTPDNMMFVVGATRAEKLVEIRSFCPDNFLLVPGVGAQGGSAEEVIRYGANSKGGLLINSSRGILYADSSANFARAAAKVASGTAVVGSI